MIRFMFARAGLTFGRCCVIRIVVNKRIEFMPLIGLKLWLGTGMAIVDPARIHLDKRFRIMGANTRKISTR